MAKENLLESIAELLRIQEHWMIQDDDGQLHHLEEGIKGTPILVTARKEIYNLYFGKERISVNDFKMLDEVHSELMHFIWENFNYKAKIDAQNELGDVIEKYGLKKVKTREKKKK
jgi:hypothetical protein